MAVAKCQNGRTKEKFRPLDAEKIPTRRTQKLRVSRAKRRKMLHTWLDSKSISEVMRVCSCSYQTAFKYKTLDKWEQIEERSTKEMVANIEGGALEITTEAELIVELNMVLARYFLNARARATIEWNATEVDKLVRLISFIKSGGTDGKLRDPVKDMTDAELNAELLDMMRQQGVGSFTKETKITVQSDGQVPAEAEVIDENSPGNGGPAENITESVQDDPIPKETAETQETAKKPLQDGQRSEQTTATPAPPKHPPPRESIYIKPGKGPQPPSKISAKMGIFPLDGRS